ncbi:MAG TPA: hypothetical protein VGH68_27430, partial [Paraburkholderia sp.]
MAQDVKDFREPMRIHWALLLAAKVGNCADQLDREKVSGALNPRIGALRLGGNQHTEYLDDTFAETLVYPQDRHPR